MNIFDINKKIIIQENEFENVVCEMLAILSRPELVNRAVIQYLHDILTYLLYINLADTSV